MTKYKNKKLVTNLLERICKARDILESKDLKQIKQSLYYFETLKNDVIRQCRKYIQYEDHELDFTHEDLKCISDEMFDVINRCQHLQYKQPLIGYFKTLFFQHFFKLFFTDRHSILPFNINIPEQFLKHF